MQNCINIQFCILLYTRDENRAFAIGQVFFFKCGYGDFEVSKNSLNESLSVLFCSVGSVLLKHWEMWLPLITLIDGYTFSI